MAADDRVTGPPAGVGGPDRPADPAFYDDLARRLRDAHRRAAALGADVRIPVIRRLLGVTEMVKRDPARASARLDELLAGLPPDAPDGPTR